MDVRIEMELHPGYYYLSLAGIYILHQPVFRDVLQLLVSTMPKAITWDTAFNWLPYFIWGSTLNYAKHHISIYITSHA